MSSSETRGRFWYVKAQDHRLHPHSWSNKEVCGVRTVRMGNNTCRLDDGTVCEYTIMSALEDGPDPYPAIEDKEYLGTGVVEYVAIQHEPIRGN